MGTLYLLDGYNVLHAMRRAKHLERADFETVRDAFTAHVGRFCTVTGHRAQIVFDGRGSGPAGGHGRPGPGTVETIYTPGHQTADAYIERRVYHAAVRRDLIVVSGDRGIRDLCFNLGALVMAPDNFLGAVDEAVAQERHTLRTVHRAHGIHTLEDRLSGANRERIERIRRRLK